MVVPAVRVRGTAARAFDDRRRRVVLPRGPAGAGVAGLVPTGAAGVCIGAVGAAIGGARRAAREAGHAVLARERDGERMVVPAVCIGRPAGGAGDRRWGRVVLERGGCACGVAG